MSFVPLALSSRTATAQQAEPQAANLVGHWVGTYFQDNMGRGYPMLLTASGQLAKFAITIDWPTLGQSQTVGHGIADASSVTWTEDQLVQGRNITLSGRYQAVPLDHDTLVGIYEHESRRRGSFMLWRTHGADDPADPSARSPSEVSAPSDQLAALERNYCFEQEARLNAMRARPEAERRKYYDLHGPDVAGFTKRFRALADANAKTAVASHALEWIAQNDRSTSDAYAAVEQLMEDHPESDELARTCFALPNDASPHAKELLERMRTQSRSPRVRGLATFALAECWLIASERQTALGGNGAGVSCTDAASRAEGLLEEVAKVYASENYFCDRKLGDVTHAALSHLRRVAIGKLAPEIDAEDLDGAKFKLSDYRGKVVVLDFWGNW
jgi:hypothetical protein